MTLIEELKAARDLNLSRLTDANGVTSVDHVVAGTTWGEALSIVERYLEPMNGLEPDALANLVDRMPCIHNERHTFDAGAKTCLCGALSVGIVSPMPTACLYSPVPTGARLDAALERGEV